MKRRIHVQDELYVAAQHVAYEIRMIIYAAQKLDGYHSSPATRPRGCEQNIALESFLLHYRNLRAFLCPSLQNLNDDDVIASDFMRSEHSADYGNARAFDSEEKKRLDKMLAHISYSRNDYIAQGKDGWEIGKMHVGILGLLEDWLALLPATERAWFPAPEFLAEEKSRARFFATASEPES
jgi:hypothetical protein